MRAVLFAFAFVLTGCPPREEHKPAGEGASACTRLGQNCEISRGKLGTCVLKDGCADLSPACFVCQSQH